MNDIMTGYKGAFNMDVGYFYCHTYMQGQKHIERDIGEQLYDRIHAINTPTAIQRRIMAAVRNETVTT